MEEGVELAEYEPRNERRNACRGMRKASPPADRPPNSPQARMKPREGVNFGRKLFPPSLPFVRKKIVLLSSSHRLLRLGLFPFSFSDLRHLHLLRQFSVSRSWRLLSLRPQFVVSVSTVPDIWLVSLVPQDVLGLRFHL